jgi:hypothetical protein
MRAFHFRSKFGPESVQCLSHVQQRVFLSGPRLLTENADTQFVLRVKRVRSLISGESPDNVDSPEIKIFLLQSTELLLIRNSVNV